MVEKPDNGCVVIKVMQSNSYTPMSTNVNQAIQSKQASVTLANGTYNGYTRRSVIFFFFFTVLQNHCKITGSRFKEIRQIE